MNSLRIALLLVGLALNLAATCNRPLKKSTEAGMDELRTHTVSVHALDTLSGLDTRHPYHQYIMSRYAKIGLAASGLDSMLFYSAYTGYLNLKAVGKTNSTRLAVADFRLPSSAYRLWVIDFASDTLLLHTWVAHGKGSGTAMATSFSNRIGSLQTSLGFYITGEEYIGKNGRSLRLDGLDPEFNSNARQRYIVMHGADYVSQDTIDAYGYLGNSEGCPAVSHQVNSQLINWMKGGGVLFVWGNTEKYSSGWLDEERALVYLQQMEIISKAH